MTTIYVPEGLLNEIGDRVIMDVDESTTNASSMPAAKRSSNPRRPLTKS